MDADFRRLFQKYNYAVTMPPKKFVDTIRRFAKPPTDVTYFNGWCYLVTHEISLACENEMFTRA